MNTTTGDALYGRFLRGLAVSPDGTAIRAGARTLSYAATHETALAWAGALVAGEQGPPRAVGVLASRGVEAYVAILAALYAGATVVPLRPDFPAARTRQMLEAAGVSALIVDDHGYAALPELLGTDLDLSVLAPGRDQNGTEGESFRLLRLEPGAALQHPRPVDASDLAYVLFTSGSTGRPKGVPITHGNTAHYFRVLDERYDFNPDDVFSQTFDLNFDCAMFDLFCAWGAGATLVCVPAHAYRDMPAFLAEENMTVWFSTPSSIGLIRRLGGLTPDVLPTLRWSFFAGEALKCQDTADWQRAASASVVENLYGPTELTITITGHRWSDDVSPRLGVNGVVPIGAVHPGHDYLLLGENGAPAESEGELCVAGPQMAGGYLDPADNEGRFLRHGSRTWYRTGDRVRRTEGGELVYLGRMDGQVQIHGWRVELAEIDHAVRTCVGVEDAVTVSASIDDAAELVVFYTGTPTSPAELVRQLRAELPYGVIPKHYRHVDEFPLNANRKTDRSGLGNRARELLGAGSGKN